MGLQQAADSMKNMGLVTQSRVSQSILDSRCRGSQSAITSQIPSGYGWRYFVCDCQVLKNALCKVGVTGRLESALNASYVYWLQSASLAVLVEGTQSTANRFGLLLVGNAS